MNSKKLNFRWSTFYISLLIIAISTITIFLNSFHFLLPNIILISTILFFLAIIKSFKNGSGKIAIYLGTTIILIYEIMEVTYFLLRKIPISEVNPLINLYFIPIGFLLILIGYGGKK